MNKVIPFKPKSQNSSNLDERMKRIQASLDKINQLLQELKRMNSEKDHES
jgi:F0F1-type ATP synthase membrane subunit b/b'